VGRSKLQWDRGLSEIDMSSLLGNPPTVYVIAGPNGAGKTTFATEFLPRVMDVPEFLNADLIAAGLAPFDPGSQAVRAARLLLERFEELVTSRKSFAFETTLAGRVYLQRIRRLKEAGYRVLLFYLWLPIVELAVERVANRVRQGGHDVPEVDIRRRFRRGMISFFTDARGLSDAWWLYDASQLPPKIVAEHRDGELLVHQTEIYSSAEPHSQG
jgi:predicted ABC-type ATPase